ncbi:MAG: gamma-glutamyl-gamma-aminobutyrate hydrolase family protein [Caldilineaceae bacterium]
MRNTEHGQGAGPHRTSAHPLGAGGRDCRAGRLPQRPGAQRGLQQHLYQDIHSERPDLEKHDYFPPKFERFRIAHQVAVEADSLLARALGRAHEVNSMHHQGIAQVGRGLRAVARAEDGLVEALEMPMLPYVLGVQWHPEELAKTDQLSTSLFYSFVRAAAGDWRRAVPDGWSRQFAHLCLNGRAPADAATPHGVNGHTPAPAADAVRDCL